MRYHTLVIGVDQTLVDIEARVPDALLAARGLVKGGSLVIDRAASARICDALASGGLIAAEHAGGTVGNTLHNYSMLADDDSLLLGVMSANI